MFFASEREALNVARTRARDIFDKTGEQPKILSGKNLSTFFGELGYAVKLVVEEREILFFAALQWVVIGLGYTIWTQVLDWIPDSAWEEAGRDDSDVKFTFLSLALTAWSFFVVAVASYPISLLNAAITAAHYLRGSGQESTIARCLGLALRNLGRLWVFTTIDAWITVDAILDRMPRKRGRRTALDEALYYAWKIGTIGVVPSLVAGRGYTSAVRDSIALLREKPVRAIGIRMGYSLICWIIGITAYIGGFYYFAAFGAHIGGENEVYDFYVLMAVPIVIAVGVTAVLVRPFYLVMVARLYTDVVKVGEDATALTAGRKFDTPAFIFAMLLTVLIAAYFFGDQMGLRDLIESLAARDMADR
ncbi:MAG: hypothetical protein AB7S41_11985 [Parvibaculaceae bacterium]